MNASGELARATIGVFVCTVIFGCQTRAVAGATADGASALQATVSGGQIAPDASRDGGTTSEHVSFRKTDGWTNFADFWREDTDRALLLVHQLASNRSEWGPVTTRMHAGSHPYTTLAFDLRGHGESTSGPDGTTAWQSFGNDTAQWEGTVRDVDAAVHFLRGRLGGLHTLVAIGSSIDPRRCCGKLRTMDTSTGSSCSRQG